MRDIKTWLWLLLFGSLWGVCEVIAGEDLFGKGVPHASVWLSAWALFVLAMARGVLNKPGSSTAVGTFAAIFKLVNAAPFFCHLLGIFFLALAFDVFSSILMKRESKVLIRTSLGGALSAYSGNALFALIMAYVVRYKYWTAGGLSKVLHHIFISGSLAALMAIAAVPLGYWTGVYGMALAKRRPGWAYTGALIALLFLWTMGRIAG